jgi:transposase
MQNEILARHDVYVPLSKLLNELFFADPTSCNSNNICLHWVVYKLDRNQNAFSSERAKTDSWNYISWHFP